MPKFMSSMVVRYATEAEGATQFAGLLLRFREWIQEQATGKEEVSVEIERLNSVIAVLSEEDAQALADYHWACSLGPNLIEVVKHHEEQRQRWISLVKLIKERAT